MKKKTKTVIGILGMLAVLSVFVIPALAQGKFDSFMVNWGKTLKEHSENRDVKESDIYMKGKSASVTEADIKQGTDFYVLSGMDEEAAREEAIKYMMKREALYAEAVRNGYSVTDDEVRAYLEELKQTIASADNKEDVEAVIKGFGSEDEYWEYEFNVYKKDLPIQKYTESLKAEYENNNISSEVQGISVNSDEDFNDFFERYKEELVEKQNYQKIK